MSTKNKTCETCQHAKLQITAYGTKLICEIDPEWSTVNPKDTCEKHES